MGVGLLAAILVWRLFLQPGRGTVIVGAATIFLFCWSMGTSLGRIPGLLGIQYLYFWPLAVIAIPIRAGPRFALACLFAFAPWGGAIYSLGGVLPVEARGTFTTTLGFVFFAMMFGEWLYQFVEANHITEQRLAALKSRLEERVEEQAGELRALAHELLVARDGERRWLSRELHDALGQELTSMSQTAGLATLQFNRGLVDDVSVTLEDLTTLIERVHETMRRIVVRMRPVVVEQLGLPDALQTLADEVHGQGGLRVELHLEGLRSQEPPPLVADTIYRVVQEALNNVVRHASAEQVDVRVGVDRGEIRVSVIDDGRALRSPPDPRGTHMGLIGIRERVIGCGGRARWGPRSEGGFAVEVTLPEGAQPGDADAREGGLSSEGVPR